MLVLGDDPLLVPTVELLDVILQHQVGLEHGMPDVGLKKRVPQAVLEMPIALDQAVLMQLVDRIDRSDLLLEVLDLAAPGLDFGLRRRRDAQRSPEALGQLAQLRPIAQHEGDPVVVVLLRHFRRQEVRLVDMVRIPPPIFSRVKVELHQLS